MAKITEYPEAQSFDAGDVILKDGSGGTKKMTVETLKTLIAPEVDTTLTQEGKPAEAKKVGEEIRGIKSAISPMAAIKHPIEHTGASGYISNNVSIGSAVSLSPKALMSYEYWIIPCAEGDTFDLHTGGADATSGVARAWSFIDADNLLLSLSTYGEIDAVITAPANAAKLIVNNKLSGGYVNWLEGQDGFLKLKADKADTNTAFGRRYLKESPLLENVIGVVKYPGNLVNISECIDNMYVIYSSGGLRANRDYFATGYIPVTEGVSYKANRGRDCAWYNSSYGYISGEQGVGITQGRAAPAGAAYIRITINKTTDAMTDPFELYFAATSDYDESVYIPGLRQNTAFSGKTIAWFGDSIVAGSDFDELVTAKLGMIEYDYGTNGATFADISGRTQLHNEWDTMMSSGITPDIIAISAGTNDFQYSVSEVGTLDLLKNGTYDTTTFYGAIASFLDTAITAFPTALIFATTPIKRSQPFSGTTPTNPFSTNNNGLTLMQYADIIKEVCGYYSVPVLDLNRESGLNPHITAQGGFFDNALTHPTAAGQYMMARRLVGWLTQLVGYMQ